MYLIYNKKKFKGLSSTSLARMAALIIALFFLCQNNAQSQNQALMDHTHPNITIDLSVISGGGSKQPTNLRSGALPSLFNRNLLRPGNQTPRSMLHVPTVNGAPLVQAKKATKVKTVPKSMLHVPPANPTPALQREKKAKAKTPPRKALAKQTKSLNVDRVKSTRKSPPPAPKIVTPIKAVPIKPSSTAKTPKKLQAPKKQVIAKIIPVPTTKIKQTSPPSAPAFNPVPKVIKKVTPTQPAAVIAKMTQAKQQASLPPANVKAEDSKKLRVSFAQDQTKLPASAKKPLTSLAASLKGTVNQRLQLMAYAGGPSLSSSLARRMSLSRALAVRSFLIENGVRSTRIDVRALGNKTTEEPLNRVDLKVTER